MRDSEKLLLSICIPTFNRRELLTRTLRSLEEGAPEVEVIIGDNSDIQSNRDIIEKTLSSFQGKWTYIRNIPPVDPVSNVNKCIQKSISKYIYILHDDDFLLPGGLKTILKTLKDHPDQHIFSFGIKVVDIEENLINTEAVRKQEFLNPKKALFNTLNNSSYIRMPSIIISREAYDNVGLWDPQMEPSDDIEMFLRLFLKYPLLKIPDLVAAYTVHKGAWTEKIFNQKTIEVLMGIFNKVEKEKILDHKVFLTAKSNFFHQFILGGAVREIKKGHFNKAQQILSLFSLMQLSSLPISKKWLPIKIIIWMLVKNAAFIRLFTKSKLI